LEGEKIFVIQSSSLYPNHYTDQTIFTFKGPGIMIYSYNKANEMHYFSNLFW